MLFDQLNQAMGHRSHHGLHGSSTTNHTSTLGTIVPRTLVQQH